MRTFLTAAILSTLLLIGIGSAQAFDYRSYGNWLNSNMAEAGDTTDFFASTGRDHTFNHPFHDRGDGATVLNATFTGDVFGRSRVTGEAWQRDTGTITIDFDSTGFGYTNRTFEATITGIEAFDRPIDGNVFTRTRGWVRSVPIPGQLTLESDSYSWYDYEGAESFSGYTEPRRRVNGKTTFKYSYGRSEISGGFYEDGDVAAGTLKARRTDFERTTASWRTQMRKHEFEGVFRASK